jgi:hypothetical protein
MLRARRNAVAKFKESEGWIYKKGWKRKIPDNQLKMRLLASHQRKYNKRLKERGIKGSSAK